MCTELRSLSELPPPIGAALGTQAQRDQAILRAVSEVLEEKERLFLEAPKNNRIDTAVLVGGDLFTVGYFGLQLVSKYIAPATQSLAWMPWATLICGEIAGGINILVGLVCLKQGLQALYNGDHALGRRLLWDFATSLVLGTAMILLATAEKVAALSAVATFLSQPWVFPALFFLTMAYIVYELANRERKIWTKQDLASQLHLDWMKANPLKNTPEFFAIEDEIAASPSKVLRVSIEKMEQLQANMGVEAALQTFRVWKHVLEKDRSKSDLQITLLEQKIVEWNRAQHVRSAQQTIYIVGILISLLMLSPGVNTRTLELINTAGTALGNGIALFMDTCWSTKRNTPIVVPKAETWADLLSPLRIA